MSINSIGVAWNDVIPSFPLHPGETVIFLVPSVDVDVEGILSLQENRKQTLTGKGALFLTNSRIIFINNNREPTVSFTTFSMDIPRVRNPEFKQPFWGANAFHCNVLIQASEPIRVKFSFNEGGAFDFWRNWAETARNYSSRQQEYVQPPPLYEEATANVSPVANTDHILNHNSSPNAPPPYQ
ncbi:hypothetical protein K7432_008464 [Basidiobolus ranarum]|uniref:GRAM domain-containing protein n=1 Tax=Basidiobolus ranarum TaxID=34480 RepID=A0ABR2VZG1_9FUNG